MLRSRSTLDELEAALDDLSTARLGRLVDALESEPDVKLTIGSWRPLCPMVLAGFVPNDDPAGAPEHRFASVWDRFARPEPFWWIRSPMLTLSARRRDIQLLMQSANSVLARKIDHTGSCESDLTDPNGQPEQAACRRQLRASRSGDPFGDR